MVGPVGENRDLGNWATQARRKHDGEDMQHQQVQRIQCEAMSRGLSCYRFVGIGKYRIVFYDVIAEWGKAGALTRPAREKQLKQRAKGPRKVSSVHMLQISRFVGLIGWHQVQSYHMISGCCGFQDKRPSHDIGVWT